MAWSSCSPDASRRARLQGRARAGRLGEMDYGFQIGGIIGMDFLRASGAVIDLGRLTIDFP